MPSPDQPDLVRRRPMVTPWKSPTRRMAACTLGLLLGGLLLLVFPHSVATQELPGSSLEGTVTSPDGRPLDGALIAAIPTGPGSPPHPVATSMSSGGGRFHFDGLAPGPYALTATVPGLAAAYLLGLQVSPGSSVSGVAIRFEGPGVTVSGVVRDAQGHGAGGVPLLATRSSPNDGDIFEVITKPDGSYAITLPRGRYTFRAGAGGLSSELKNIEGADQKLDWTLDPRAEEERGAPPEVVTWIRDHAIPIKTPEAGHGFEDMQPMKKLVGDARIVALGESTHGTREFFQFKHRMLEFLATEMGFTVFGIEANWPESLAVNDYVLNGTGDPARALKGMYFWTWDTQEVLEMIRWMRRYNEDPRHPRKLKFYGFDMQFPSVAADRVLEYLRRVDPESVPAATRVLAPLRRKDAMYSYPRRGADYRESIASGLARLLRQFTENKRLYISRSSEAEWAMAEHQARIVWQAEQNRSAPLSKSPRDRFMADNVRWLLDQEGKDARMMVWAHNGHVAFSTGTYAYKPMGAFLKETYGRAYEVLGFAFNRGGFQARSGSQGLRVFTARPALESSLDGTLARAGIPLFVVDLRTIPPSGPVRNWWYGRHLTRSIGAIYSDAAGVDYFMAESSPSSYDGLIFIESTTAARPNTSLGHP